MTTFFSKVLVAGLALMPICAQGAANAGEPLVRIHLDSVNLSAAGTDHVRLEVRASAAVSREVKITRIRFESMTLGDIPFFMDPVDQPLRMRAGEPASLPPIPVTIYYRDLESLESLQTAVREGRVFVNGQARADLDLNLLDRVTLRQWLGRADLPIHNTIALNVPGGELGRKAAVATIGAAQGAMALAGSALNVLHRTDADWNQNLALRYAPAMIFAQARYSLLFNNGQRVDLSVPGLGFRISKDRFVVTAEMIEPWTFDADAALLLRTHEAALVPDSYDLLVWPGDPSMREPARRMSSGDMRIESLTGKTETVLMPHDSERVRVTLAKRDCADNMAVLSFTHEDDWFRAVPAASSSADPQQAWDRLAVFHLTNAGRLAVILIPGQRKDGRLVFDAPVDQSAFGSPVIAPEGMVGMVQEERSALPIAW